MLGDVIRDAAVEARESVKWGAAGVEGEWPGVLGQGVQELHECQLLVRRRAGSIRKSRWSAA